MEYRKSYLGFVLWLVGYSAAMFLPVLMPGERWALMTRAVLAIAAAGLAALMALILLTEKIYWMNGVSFEQAAAAGSERRRAYARAHLKAFGLFAAAQVAFSALMQALEVPVGVDVAAFGVGALLTGLAANGIDL